jgi:hypothetical protein
MPSKTLLFALGSLYFTPGAIAAFEESSGDFTEFLHRHVTGDWSEMSSPDQEENQLAIQNGKRVFSAYHLSSGQKIWVITEADRSATTILLPEEY